MNPNQFEEKLRTLDDLVPLSVESKQTVELKPGVWNGETMSCVEYVPVNAPESYKRYRRLYASFCNRRAIFESLYYSAGGVDTQRYLDAMADIERNLEELKKFYQHKSVSLLIVDKEGTPQIDVKLFTDIYLCNAFTKQVLGLTTDEIEAKQVPARYGGTRIFEQEWYTSEEQIIHNYPTPTNTTANRANSSFTL